MVGRLIRFLSPYISRPLSSLNILWFLLALFFFVFNPESVRTTSQSLRVFRGKEKEPVRNRSSRCVFVCGIGGNEMKREARAKTRRTHIDYKITLNFAVSCVCVCKKKREESFGWRTRKKVRSFRIGRSGIEAEELGWIL